MKTNDWVAARSLLTFLNIQISNISETFMIWTKKNYYYYIMPSLFDVSLALQNFQKKINCFSKAIILVNSKAAIQVVVANHDTETQIISEIRQILNFLMGVRRGGHEGKS